MPVDVRCTFEDGLRRGDEIKPREVVVGVVVDIIGGTDSVEQLILVREKNPEFDWFGVGHDEGGV